MQRRFIQLLIFSLFLSALAFVQPAHSQSELESCVPQVQKALEQVGTLCEGLTRNSACYGNSHIQATFIDPASAEHFAKPGDTAGITELQSIDTAPLDESSEVWGVSLLRLQASIPNTLPGQGVVFVLFGDMRVENAVNPADTYTPVNEPVQVTTQSAANIRSSSSTTANVLLSVPSGTELPADATSTDLGWLRVVSDKTVGWVSKSVVRTTSDDAAELPVLTRSSRVPMQSFYLTSGMNGVDCNQAPPLVVVQGPENVTVDLTVNGVDISMGSTIVVRMLDPQHMQVTTIHGNVRVGNLPLPEGFSVIIPLSADGRSQAGDFINVHPLVQEELNNLLSIEWIPPNVLNYPIHLPTLGEINAQIAALGGGGGVVSAEAASHVSCRKLRLTSPLDAWGRRATTFYWDAAPGATSYRLNIDGMSSVETRDTFYSYDLTPITGTSSMTWSVQALYNGVVACQTRPLTLPLDPNAGGGNTNSPNNPSSGGGCHYDIETHEMVCT